MLPGDRPSAPSWLGITVAVPALWLVAQEDNQATPPGSGPVSGGFPRTAPVNALVAGVGIALQYLALAQATPGSGSWPVTAGRVTAILIVLPLALSARERLRLPVRQTLASAATGMLAGCSLVCDLLAVGQLVVVAVVLSCLYPAIPVLLGLAVPRERLNPLQAAGRAGSAVAVGFLTIR